MEGEGRGYIWRFFGGFLEVFERRGESTFFIYKYIYVCVGLPFLYELYRYTDAGDMVTSGERLRMQHVQ